MDTTHPELGGCIHHRDDCPAGIRFCDGAEACRRAPSVALPCEQSVIADRVHELFVILPLLEACGVKDDLIRASFMDSNDEHHFWCNLLLKVSPRIITEAVGRKVDAKDMLREMSAPHMDPRVRSLLSQRQFDACESYASAHGALNINPCTCTQLEGSKFDEEYVGAQWRSSTLAGTIFSHSHYLVLPSPFVGDSTVFGLAYRHCLYTECVDVLCRRTDMQSAYHHTLALPTVPESVPWFCFVEKCSGLSLLGLFFWDLPATYHCDTLNCHVLHTMASSSATQEVANAIVGKTPEGVRVLAYIMDLYFKGRAIFSEDGPPFTASTCGLLFAHTLSARQFLAALAEDRAAGSYHLLERLSTLMERRVSVRTRDWACRDASNNDTEGQASVLCRNLLAECSATDLLEKWEGCSVDSVITALLPANYLNQRHYQDNTFNTEHVDEVLLGVLQVLAPEDFVSGHVLSTEGACLADSLFGQACLYATLPVIKTVYTYALAAMEDRSIAPGDLTVDLQIGTWVDDFLGMAARFGRADVCAFLLEQAQMRAPVGDVNKMMHYWTKCATSSSCARLFRTISSCKGAGAQ